MYKFLLPDLAYKLLDFLPKMYLFHRWMLIVFPYSLFCQPVWKTYTLRNALANYWGRRDMIIGLRNMQGC